MEHIRKLVDYLNEKDPELRLRASDTYFAHLETVLLPHLLRVVQKDNTLLSEIELLPGLNVGKIWDGSDTAWSRLHMALLHSFMHGDPKEKMGKLVESLKTMIPNLPGVGAQADQFMNMLNSEDNQASIKEMLELVMNTRLASLVSEIVQSLQFTDLDIKLDDPEEVMEMMRNPMAHPALKEIMDRAQMLLREKIETGKINQQDLRREIETLRAKFQSAFGKYLNESIIGAQGNTTGNTADQILSNHPEARRARMLARMQKKQRGGGGGGGPAQEEVDEEAIRRANAMADELLREEETELTRAAARAKAQKKPTEKQLRK
jgi:hypothetical protein